MSTPACFITLLNQLKELVIVHYVNNTGYRTLCKFLSHSELACMQMYKGLLHTMGYVKMKVGKMIKDDDETITFYVRIFIVIMIFSQVEETPEENKEETKSE